MNPAELKKLRLMRKITLLELAANMGLPANYVRQIEEEEVVALESDLERIEKAIEFIYQRKKIADKD